MGRGHLDGLDHLLDTQLEVFRKVIEGRVPAGLGRELPSGLLDLDGALLSGTRDVYRPPRVPEVALQLSKDGWNCERLEGDATSRLESIDCFHKCKTRHLHQVLERFLGALK